MRGRRRSAAATVSVVLLLAGCRARTVGHGAAAQPVLPPISNAAARPSTFAPVTSPSAAPSPAPSVSLRPPGKRAVAALKIAALARSLPPGAMSVAVLNTRTGARFTWGATTGMWTGSVYKVLVLEALLLQRQGNDGWFTESEYADITAMIEKSNNDAGYRMYLTAGGSAGLVAAAGKLGLRHTSIGRADPALTAMSASDGVRLLHDLVSPGPLDKQSRAFVLDLLRNVQADQRWGVGVLADRGTSVANKNGWMDVGDDNDPGEDDDDLWLANSLGIVQVHGQQLLMAVFTRHNPDRDTGIRLVERLARLAGPAVA